MLLHYTILAAQGSSTGGSKTATVTGNWVQQYDVPWEKFSKIYMQSLKEGKRPLPSQRRQMVRTLVDDILKVCARPHKKHLEQIARTIVNTYPASFRDDIEGLTVGTGYDSLQKQLTSRVENCLRKLPKPVSRRRLNTDCAMEPDAASKRKEAKKHQRDSYGCINYSPEDYPDGETKESLEAMRTTMQETYSRSENCPNLDELMTKTYILQRRDILQERPVLDLMTEWPYFFTKQGLFINFKELAGIDIENNLQLALSTKFSGILGFMKDQGGRKVQNILCRIEAAERELGNSSPKIPGVFMVLMEHFGEKLETLVLEKEVGFKFLTICPPKPGGIRL